MDVSCTPFKSLLIFVWSRSDESPKTYKFEYLIRSRALEYSSTSGRLNEILNALLDEWLVTCGYAVTGYSGNGTRCDTVHPAAQLRISLRKLDGECGEQL